MNLQTSSDPEVVRRRASPPQGLVKPREERNHQRKASLLPLGRKCTREFVGLLGGQFFSKKLNWHHKPDTRLMSLLMPAASSFPQITQKVLSGVGDVVFKLGYSAPCW